MKNIELGGQNVNLIPLKVTHREALIQAASDGKLGELGFTSVLSIAAECSTRYCNAIPDYKRLEIGCTWLAKKYQ